MKITASFNPGYFKSHIQETLLTLCSCYTQKAQQNIVFSKCKLFSGMRKDESFVIRDETEDGRNMIPYSPLYQPKTSPSNTTI